MAVVRRDDTARIEVDDAGPGLPVSEREHIFESFTRGVLLDHPLVELPDHRLGVATAETVSLVLVVHTPL